MELEYYRARKYTNKGPLVHIIGSGQTVCIPLHGKVTVSDKIGHDLLSKYGDILRQVQPRTQSDPIEPKKETKQVKKVQNKQVKTYSDKSDLAEI